jgi:hypothetical protein
MPFCAQARRFVALALLLGSLGACRDNPPPVEPHERPPARPAPALDEDDEALLASLLADDPSDYHVARARIWRLGPARWTTDGPAFPGAPNTGLRGGALEQPLEVVVVDGQAGPRVLLPLGDLDRGARAPSWSALRLLAVLAPGDLVAGLTRELRPTPWLTLAAGIGLTPREREGEQLRVSWSDPDCGFGLELAIDAKDFGPHYEPGPSGRPDDAPEPSEGPSLRLAPGAQIYADASGREPIVRIDPEAPSEAALLSAAQRVTRIGKPVRKLQEIELRCRGVVIRGHVTTTDIVEIPGRFAVVEAAPPPSSSCAGFESESILVPHATPLYEPQSSTLVGVVAADVELAASPASDGWWRSCVPSPWGDLIFDFRLR